MAGLAAQGLYSAIDERVRGQIRRDQGHVDYVDNRRQSIDNRRNQWPPTTTTTKYKNLIRVNSNKYKPAPGYEWVDPNDPQDFRVRKIQSRIEDHFTGRWIDKNKDGKLDWEEISRAVSFKDNEILLFYCMLKVGKGDILTYLLKEDSSGRIVWKEEDATGEEGIWRWRWAWYPQLVPAQYSSGIRRFNYEILINGKQAAEGSFFVEYQK